MATATLPTSEEHTDTFPINGTDFIEFYVGNAKQAAHFYCSAFGFNLVAYRGPETGTRETASYLVQQDKVRLLLTTPIKSTGEIADHIRKHGDGVKDIALWVDDARKAFSLAVERGAKPAREPSVIKDEHGEIVSAAIHLYGDTIHSLIERKNYRGLFMPGFVAKESVFKPVPVGLKYVDHCVGNVELGAMNKWVKFYEDVLGFVNILSFDDKTISTEYSALMSKVMSNGNGRIKFPINEPAQGKKKSQIDEYLEFYDGPGVQHIAIATDDIISTVSRLRERGVEFLRVPPTYYDTVLDRVGHIDEDLASLRELGILVDRDDEGYLLQIFTKPVEDRPTVFYEIIERKGAKSFGAGNFKALFEALEREQELRGNL
ncbi:MAG TPA: 4-hydroxyphenylpyruvate dioxygenase [Gemmatimonadaceae bacterium]|jgi:4-hydroxyphenylpyruvate dioxygenase|nr:4-hydroxyphenylpyruvate dioxygenase [Gemmatimonadaceae bacterium]